MALAESFGALLQLRTHFFYTYASGVAFKKSHFCGGAYAPQLLPPFVAA